MNNCKGFTLIELIATMVIFSVLAAILIPRYMDAETASKYRAIDMGVSEMNSRETLSWAPVKLSTEGYRDDDQVWAQLLAARGSTSGRTMTGSSTPRGRETRRERSASSARSIRP